MLGNGMYNVAGPRYTKFKGTFGPPKLIAQLQLEFADGTSETLVTDSAWKATAGPITFSSIYGGEDYDARLEQPGWDAPGFDDAAWVSALEVNGPGWTAGGIEPLGAAHRGREGSRNPEDHRSPSPAPSSMTSVRTALCCRA